MDSLFGCAFNHYRSGVYEGQFIFEKDKIIWCPVDPQTRVQLKQIAFQPHMKPSLFDFVQLKERLELYARARWEGDRVTLPDGTRYNRYVPLFGEVAGREMEACLWAQ